jgi:predicted aspartyl protease
MEFIEQLRYLPSAEFPKSDCTEEERKLYDAAKTFLASDEAQAEEIAKQLFQSTENEEVKSAAASLLFHLLVWQERFDEITDYGIPRNQEEAVAVSLFNTTKKMTAKLTDKTDCLELVPSSVGWAVATVNINGHNVDLMIDTGAGITVINESIANKCGVVMDSGNVDSKDAIGNDLSLPTATLAQISIGNSKFINKRCMVIPDSALDFGEVKINGTIGWELIKQLKWVFDLAKGSAFVSAPKPSDVKRNMAYDAFPLVSVEIEGKKMTVGLDTGATTTRFGKSMSVEFPDTSKSTQQISGAGGSMEDSVCIVPKVNIAIDGGVVSLKDVSISENNECSKSGFFITPGILGIDIAKESVLTLDYFNRHISISTNAEK